MVAAYQGVKEAQAAKVEALREHVRALEEKNRTVEEQNRLLKQQAQRVTDREARNLAERDAERAAERDANNRAVAGIATTLLTVQRRMVEAADGRRGGPKPAREKAGCVCCMAATATWALTTCGHLVACDGCRESVLSWGQCPTCRAAHSAYARPMIKVYTSGIDIFDDEKQ